MIYSDFLRSKIAVAPNSGIEVRPEDGKPLSIMGLMMRRRLSRST